MNSYEYWRGWHLIPLEERPEGGDALRAYTRQQQRRKQQAICLDILAQDHPRLAYGERDVTLPPSSVATLLEKISDGATTPQLPIRHNYLVKGLNRGCKELDWKLPVPSPMVKPHRESSPVTPLSLPRLTQYRDLQLAYRRSLEQDLITGLSEQKQCFMQAGQLLFSFINEGNLLHRYWLGLLPDAIQRGIGRHADVIWLDLEQSSTDSPSSRDEMSTALRRVFPGSVSMLLLRRWYKRYGAQWPTERTPEQLLRQYFRSVAPGFPLPRALLGWLLEAATTAAHFKFPGFITHYAQSRSLGVSLDSDNWYRLVSRQRRWVEIEAEEADPISIPGSATLPRAEGSQDQLRALRQLRAILKSPGNRVTPVIRKLKEYLNRSELSPIVRLLAHWCLKLLSTRGRTGQRRRPSSVRTYLSRIAKPLVTHAAHHGELDAFSATDWEALYDQVLASAHDDDNRAVRARQLRDFHEFLERDYGVASLVFEHNQGPGHQVDARIMTPAEFMRARRLIRHGQIDHRLAVIQELVLILGYRCGLRRTEVLTLQQRDLPGLAQAEIDYPEVIVRTNLFAAVKSPASIRRLPLHQLLMDDELSLLRQWLLSRQGETLSGRAEQTLLFCRAGEDRQLLGDLDLFRPIQDAMRRASGDGALRFHHLRHSFATLQLLRLLEAIPGQYLPTHWAHDDSGHLVLPCWDDDYSRLANLAPQHVPTRKRLWALSLWCGHAGPGETLASYCHLLDWLLARHVSRQEDIELSIQAQASLLDVTPGSLSVFRNRHGLTGPMNASELVTVLKDSWSGFEAEFDESQWHTPRLIDLAPTTRQTVYLSASLVYRVLHLFEQRWLQGENEDETDQGVGATFALSPATVKSWRQRACDLMTQRTSRGAYRLSRRNAFCRDWFSREGGQQMYAPEILLCLAPPRSGWAQQQANRYYRRLLEWHHTDPVTCEMAIRTVLCHMQRTHGQLKLAETKDKVCFLALLRWLRLGTYTRIQVILAKDQSIQAATRYWAETLGEDRKKIHCQYKSNGRPTRHPQGNAQVVLGQGTNTAETSWLWPTLRFAVFTACVTLLEPLDSSSITGK